MSDDIFNGHLDPEEPDKPRKRGRKSKDPERKGYLAIQQANRQRQEQETEARLKSLFLEALSHFMDDVTSACRTTGVTRKQFKAWMLNDAAFNDAVFDVKEEVVDFAESKLRERISGVEVERETYNGPVIYKIPPDVTAIGKFLEAKARNRGYGLKNDILPGGRGGQRMPDISEELSDEDASRAYLDALKGIE